MSFTPLRKNSLPRWKCYLPGKRLQQNQRHNPSNTLRMHVGNFGGFGVRQSGRVPVHTTTHSGYVQRLLRPWPMSGHLPLPSGNLLHTWQSATLTQGADHGDKYQETNCVSKIHSESQVQRLCPKPIELTSRRFANTRTDLGFLCRTARRAILPALMTPRKSLVIVFRYDSVQHPFVLRAGV